jgi:phosphotransacetylase
MDRDLEVDGEMHGDCRAVVEDPPRGASEFAPERRCQPADHADVDAANISFNLLKVAAGAA